MGFLDMYVLGLSLLSLTLAQECNRDFYVASQDDADNVGRDCSIVNGSVFINGTYSGSLVLNRVRNITVAFRVAWWDLAPTPQLTSVELPDLEYVRWIDLPKLTASKFSAQKLEGLDNMSLGQAAHGSELDFGSLVTAERSMTIIGNYSSVNLASLETMNGELSICSIEGCKEDEPYSSISSTMNLTLSSLTSIPRLQLAVKTESISLPYLNTMTEASSRGPEVDIHVLDATASVSLPQLASLKGTLDIQGSISSLNLSSLRDAEGDIYIATTHPLNISLPIVSAEYLALTGAVEGVRLPTLEGFANLYINSSLPLDCGQLDREFNDIAEALSARYTCQSTAEGRTGLSTRVKVAIGVVVGVVGAGILGGLAFWWKRRKGQGLSKSSHASQVELMNLSRAGVPAQTTREQDLDREAPPPYSPR